MDETIEEKSKSDDLAIISEDVQNESSTQLNSLYCQVRGIELKESSDGEFYVDGFIATSHIDMVGDRIPKNTLDAWAKEINSKNPQSNKVSLHHERKPQVVGKGEPPATVVRLPDGEFGLRTLTHVNRSWDGFNNLIYEVKEGFIDGFSIEFTTKGNETVTFETVGNKEIRVFKPETELHGWAFASRPVNNNATVMGYGFKEAILEIPIVSVNEQIEKQTTEVHMEQEALVEEEKMAEDKEVAATPIEQKENDALNKILERLNKMEVKEQVLKTETKESAPISIELKEFAEVLEGKSNVDIMEQFRRAAAVMEKKGLISAKGFADTVDARQKEYKCFRTNGTKLEYKSLGITTNQNTDTDYLLSSAELADAFDPVIYNMLNQGTVTWNILAKDSYAGKGNNQVQFTAKTAANATASFYTGNAVTTGNATRLKYQTKFKKLQVGVSVDGDMIAAARGGPVSDVFAQEVADATMDMLSVLNAALFAEVGAETAAAPIGFEYISDSAGNTTLYSLTRSATNKLSPDSAGDTYINMSSAVISMANLRSAIKQAVIEGANKKNLVFITHPIQANFLRGKFDDARRFMTSQDTSFGFTTDLVVDGVPVFEDKDCNTDDWWLIDRETHRIGIWVPPTIEKLGKSADSEDAFIKMYLAVYNRAPRRLVQIYGCATS